MNHGLSAQAVAGIREVFAGFPAIERVVLYGSRAKGNYKPGSDIDLTLHGAALTGALLGRIADALDDLLLPCRFDLSRYADLANESLRDHIARVGWVLYERGRVPDDQRDRAGGP